MTHIDLTDIRISDAGLFSKEPLTGSGNNPAVPDKRAHLLPWLRSMKALIYMISEKRKGLPTG